MDKKLELKRWPEFRNYTIVPEGLRVELKSGGSYSQQTIKYEDIGFEEQLLRYKPSPIAIGLFISLTLNFLCIVVALYRQNIVSTTLVYVLSAVVGIGMGIWARRLFKFDKEKFLLGNINIPFWYFEKYQAMVDQFLVDLKLAKNEYFRNKFFKQEPDEDFLTYKERMSWLKTEGYITEEEYRYAVTHSEMKKPIKGF